MHIPAGVNFYLRHGARGASSANVSSSGSAVPASQSTAATSSVESLIQLPTSSKSLIGICTVVGTILLAIIIWQIRTLIFKRKGARAALAARTRFSYMYGVKEKPAFVSFSDTTESDNDPPRKSAVLNPAPSDPYARWKPQIKGVTVPPIAVTHAERSPKVQDEYPPTPKSGPLVSPLPSPPPAYRILGLHTIPVPESPPQESEPTEIPPPTPMHRSPRRTASTPMRESFDLPPVPTPSPRSASFQHTTDNTPAPTPQANLASLSARKSFPRLMIVTTSFESTLPDELSLRAGETLRLIREFDDEWCLVQRVGRHTAEKGVVPRFCLSERPRVVRDYVRFSNSIFNTVHRK